MSLKILVACEESQVVTIELRKLGHEAYSCDIMECSGNHSEWHLKQNVIPLLDKDWDMIIAFPPCTHLAVSGARHFENKRIDGRQKKAIEFFGKLLTNKCPKIAIENPVGIISGEYIKKHFPNLCKLYGLPLKPSQIIQPYQFGDKAQKTTCLWIKGLPLLKPTNVVDKGEFYISPSGKKMPSWCCDPVGKDGKKLAYNSDEIKKLRSKTFLGIAKAMSIQWTK